jgi:hypothetical protein
MSDSFREYEFGRKLSSTFDPSIHGFEEIYIDSVNERLNCCDCGNTLLY